MMKDIFQLAVSRLTLTGLTLLALGLMPLQQVIGDCELLQIGSTAAGLVLVIFALGRESRCG